jgi:hypothetical protein
MATIPLGVGETGTLNFPAGGAGRLGGPVGHPLHLDEVDIQRAVGMVFRIRDP